MILTVANLKGGSGRTTTALMLAQVASEHGASVRVVDAVYQAMPHQPLNTRPRRVVLYRSPLTTFRSTRSILRHTR
nr:AAA family ATPase [Corynebacterium auriscanis]